MIMLYVGIISIILFLVLRIFRVDKCDLDKIPGPPGLPIFGNLFDLLQDRVGLFKIFREWDKKYGTFYKTSVLGVMNTIELANPDDIETVLSSSVHIKKSFFYPYLKPWLGDGLLISGGAKWHERRKLLTPTFHFNILRDFTAILEENSQSLVKNLEEEVNKPKTNIVPILSDYTLNSICETAMGTKIDNQAGVKYKEAVYAMGGFIVERFTKIWYQSDFLHNLSSNGFKQRKCLEIIKHFTDKVINEREQYRETYSDEIHKQKSSESDDISMKTKRRMALLDLLLTAETENKIDRQGTIDEVETFMFEGHDTTAVALNFALMVFANRKDIQDKIVDEIREVFGDSDREATMEDLNQMKYLECCIKESLRLYPSAPLIARQFEQKITLSNYVIPPGTFCNIHILDLHRQPDLFPDPLVFDPNRFTPENSVNRHPYAYIPFSAGPRNCIGQKFAMLEMKSAIVAILRKLELHPITKPSDIQYCGDLVLRSAKPIYVSFKKRN